MDSKQKIALGATILLVLAILFIWEAKLGARYMVATLVLFVALLLWWPAARRSPTTVRVPRPSAPNPHEQFAASIERMPLEQAREMAESYLNNPRFWRLSPPADHGIDRFERYGPVWQHLLIQHRSIDSAVGEAGLTSVGIQRFDWPNSQVLRFGAKPTTTAEYFRVGTDFDGNPIVAKPDDDRLYVVHNTESKPERWWLSDYPSFYHWVLIQHGRVES